MAATATPTKPASRRRKPEAAAPAPKKEDKRSTSGPAKRAENKRLKEEAEARAAAAAAPKPKRSRAMSQPEARTNQPQKAAVRAAATPAPKKGNGMEDFQVNGVFKRAAHLYKQIGDPTRLAIIYMLSGGEKHVGAMASALEQSQPAVSHHLALLKHNGIVTTRRHGKHNFYSLVNPVVARVIEHLEPLADTHRTS